jgi:outer membrane protein insertion porin family
VKRLWSQIIVVVLSCTRAWAQAPTPSTPVDDTVVSATKFDPSACGKTPATPTPTGVAPPPVTWNGFDVEGQLRDSATTVRALLEPTMNRHRALTEAAREDIARITLAFGYHLVGLGTRDTPTGVHAVVALAALPMVRKVGVNVKQPFTGIFSNPLLDDEIRRRMRLRTGSYLPWTPTERKCELYEEERRIEEYLRDEGYIGGKATVREQVDGLGINLKVTVKLGDEYTTGRVRVADPGGLTVDEADIKARFHHWGSCILGEKVTWLCWGTARFKRAQHQDDIQGVVKLFHDRGFPAVRVRTDYDPLTSFDRRTKTVSFTVSIDPRRYLNVVFEGHNPDEISDEDLRSQLTFNEAASSDDVEANESARAITAYLQSRGYFDARVTWSRERFDRFDRLIYRIDQGRSRSVLSIEFVGSSAIDKAVLADAVGTRAGSSTTLILGTNTSATSAQLAADVDRLVETYRRAGYRDARVRVSAATDPAALDSAALTAAFLTGDRGTGLHVRFTIDEGLPTMLTQIHIDLGAGGDAITTPDQRTLCQQALADLSELYGAPELGTSVNPDRCVASAPDLKFRESEAVDIGNRLRDRLYGHGRPRARVTYEPQVIGPRRIAAHYKLGDVQPLKIGKVVIRGNFRTVDSIILGELQFKEGAPLTKDALAEGARRLRATGLFDAVNVAMPDLDNTSEGTVNAVVEVSERHDVFAQLDAEIGGSTYNGAFVRLTPGFKNLLGRGISLDLSGTLGFELGELVTHRNLKLRQLAGEANLRFPEYLWRLYVPLVGFFAFQTDITAFHRRQDTQRFGELTTDGATVALSHTWARARSGNVPAHALTLGIHYDFRLRERPVDVLRPVGADDDQSQVPISTRTGSVGITGEWEQRVDRGGSLSPLAPEAGFRLEGQVSIASPALFGQDTFIKASAAASKFWPIGANLILRADLRYDQGFPLGGAVLLPEVERFFAGGDSTVRGYNDDRLATEIVQVGVPPLGNVQQIRILPAGGNIRVIGSVDAQLRIWKLLATALFFDAGVITNQWSTVTENDIRPSVGAALLRIVTPFGAFAFERAIPLRPQLGDDPRGRWHISFAARAQF